VAPFDLAFHPDGRTVAVAVNWDDNSIRLWDLQRTREVQRLPAGPQVSSIAFSPDGRTLVSATVEGAVRLWEVATGKQIFLLDGHERAVMAVAISPDGRLIASADGSSRLRHTGDGLMVPGRDPHRLVLWDSDTGKQVGRFQGHDSNITSLAFSPDGARLASGL